MLNFLSKFIFVSLISTFASFALAQENQQILRWAADTESGAPYVFYDAKTLKMTGYEYDIITALAAKMNMKPEFVQNAWDGLILGLNNNLYDVAINGLEILDERKKTVFFSEPYYATSLSIIVKQGDERFKKLSDFSGYRVGTLSGALAEKVLKSDETIKYLGYDSEALAHQDLLLGRSDALLLDAPIAKYFSEVDKRFQVIPTLIGSMTYGIAISKKNPELLKKVNKALEQMIASGELKAIYEKWGLWNNSTATLFNDFSVTRQPPTEYEKYKTNLNHDRSFSEKIAIYQKTLPLFLKAAWLTVKISVLSMVVAVLFGLLLATIKLYGPGFASKLVTAFIEFIRGTPLLLQLFFVFYALPSLGIEISAFWAAVLSLGINYSVQECEIYRAGLLQVHHNQTEAAKMLGLTKWQCFWSVEVPQAIRFCLPPMTTDFIALIKDSSLVSVITLVDITKTYSTLSSTYYEYVGFAAIAAILYFLLGFPLVLLSKRLEKKLTLQR